MKNIKIFSNITFYATIGLSIYLIASFFITRRGLPPGVCPIDNNRPLLYVTIGLAIISFVLSILESRLKKD